MREWRNFERTDVSPVGEQRREQLAAYITDLEAQVLKFEEQRDRKLALEEQKRERKAS